MRVTVVMILFCLSAHGLETWTAKPDRSQIDNAQKANHEKYNQPKTAFQSVGLYYEVTQAKGNSTQEQYDPRSDKLYRAYLWATIIGVGGGIIGISFLIVQTLASKAAAKAAMLNAQAVINAERAWFCLNDNPFPQEPSLVAYNTVTPEDVRKAHCFVDIKNFGNTPAKLIGTKFRLMIGTGFNPPDIAAFFACAYDSSCDVIPSGANRFYQAELFPNGVIDSFQLEDLQKGNTSLWICGAVQYEDVFAQPKVIHETKFCYLRETRTNAPKPFWVGVGPKDYNSTT